MLSVFLHKCFAWRVCPINPCHYGSFWIFARGELVFLYFTMFVVALVCFPLSFTRRTILLEEWTLVHGTSNSKSVTSVCCTFTCIIEAMVRRSAHNRSTVRFPFWTYFVTSRLTRSFQFLHVPRFVPPELLPMKRCFDILSRGAKGPAAQVWAVVLELQTSNARLVRFGDLRFMFMKYRCWQPLQSTINASHVVFCFSCFFRSATTMQPRGVSPQ